MLNLFFISAMFLFQTCSPVFSATNDRRISADYVNGQDSRTNYIVNGDAEDSAPKGWVCYADAAGTRPVDGTGGVPNVTMTRTAIGGTPFSRNYYWAFSKDAANRQGHGCSYDFTVSPKHKAKTLYIETDFAVVSGTYAAGDRTTDSDTIFDIYDVTNGSIIEPTAVKILSNSTSTTWKFKAEFQTAYNSTSYRLIKHVATTSASAYTVGLEEVKVSETKSSAERRAVAFKAVRSSSQTGINTNASSVKLTWNSVSDDSFGGFDTTNSRYVAQVSGRYVFSYLISLNSTNILGSGAQYTADFYKNGSLFSSGNVVTNATAGTYLRFSSVSHEVEMKAGDYVEIFVYGSGNNSASNYSTDQVATWFSGHMISQSSDGGGSGQVAARLVSSGTQSIATSTWTKVTILTVSVLDTSGMNGSSRVTIQTPGIYSVTPKALFASNATGARAVSLAVNGGSCPGSNGAGVPGVGADTIEISNPSMLNLKSGDYIEGCVYQSSGGALNLIGADLLVAKYGGNGEAISSGETIAAAYIRMTTQSISNTTDVTAIYDSRILDTLNGMNTSTGRYTCFVAGTYRVSASLFWTASTSGGVRQMRVVRRNSAGSILSDYYKDTYGRESANNIEIALRADQLVPCNSGDTLEIMLYQNSGGSLTTIAGINFFNVQRIGF